MTTGQVTDAGGWIPSREYSQIGMAGGARPREVKGFVWGSPNLETE